MSQLLKNLLTKGISLRNALNTSKLYGNKHILEDQFLHRALFNLDFKRLYISNTDTNTSFDLKYKKINKFEHSSDHGNNKKHFGHKRRFEYQNRTGSRFEDFENAQPVQPTGQQIDYSNKKHTSFRDYDIPEKLLIRLEQLGYTSPYEIQEKTLRHTLDGKDLVGKAFTGSGKTLAFAIPIVSRILKSESKSRFPKCLVLSPTRELCLQLTKAIQELSPDLKCISILGGTGYESQIKALNGKVDIVCATPGRLRDLMNRKNFIADDIEIICLDEADELLNPNFVEQIHDVIEMTSKKQMLMFSATINKSVQGLIAKYMTDPKTIDLTEGQNQKLPSNIEHLSVRAHESLYDQIILHCINNFKSERCIIFSNMKRDAIRLNFFLNRNGFKTSDLHSDLSQRKREIILEKFRKGSLEIIVATDVAARGIDIPEVDLVIQAGAPVNGIDFYIHRSGRTGRAGRIGRSVLIDDGTKPNFSRMIKRLVSFKTLELPEWIVQKNSELMPNISNEEGSEFRGKYSKRNEDWRPRENFRMKNYMKYFDKNNEKYRP